MAGYIFIGKRKIGTGQPVFLIAEAGVNHNGDIRIAIKMIDAASRAGADAIKFQTFVAEELATPDAPKAGYQKKYAPGGTQLDMLKKLELGRRDFVTLRDHCHARGILFLSTPFDIRSAELLQDLKVPAFKIGSGEITNMPLLSKVARYGKPVILSTGMSTMEEVRAAVRCVYSTGNRRLALLHCTSNYPAAYEDVNLKAMQLLMKEFRVPTGYSDHTPGSEVSLAAVAMGAGIIEKHFTLDKDMRGPDHASSVEPEELSSLISSVRIVEKAVGKGIKRPCRNELDVKNVVRKSIVAASSILGGTVLTEEMLTAKRPAGGIEPKHIPRLIGSKARMNIKKDEKLTWRKVML